MADSNPDFLIVGAGIAGVALASELATAGAAVTIIEATQVCGGSSALNAGGVRQQFSQEINIRLSRRTVERLEHLRDDRGIDLSHRQVGYLFLISDEDSVRPLQDAIRTQNALGVPSRWMSVDEIGDAVPGTRLDDLVGATFCPNDGYLDPNTFVSVLAADARRAGALIRSNTSVVGFEHTEQRINSIRLSSGDLVSAGVVVNCAGAWANSITALYGAELPIVPWHSQCFQIGGVSAMPMDCPVTIDFNNGKTYFHAEQSSFLAGTDAGDACQPSWKVPFDRSGAELLVQRLTSRHSTFENASVIGGWAGMLELTPDENPIADWTHFDNLYTMAGFSGHGMAIAPGLAEEVALLLLGSSTNIDLSPYRLGRFDEIGSTESAEAMSMR